jgi:hypothetical protein
LLTYRRRELGTPGLLRVILVQMADYVLRLNSCAGALIPMEAYVLAHPLRRAYAAA